MGWTGLLQSLEAAIFEIALWFVLVPKTLFHVAVRPRRIVDLVQTEGRKEGPDRYSEYMSPILLWLLVGVIPGIWLIAHPSSPGWLKVPFASKLTTENLVLASAIVILPGPLSFSVATDVVRRQRLSRNALRQTFEMQCLCFAPFLLSFFCSEFAYFNSELAAAPYDHLWSIVRATFLVGGGAWFLYAELSVIKTQLGASVARSIGVFCLGMLTWIAIVSAIQFLVYFVGLTAPKY